MEVGITGIDAFGRETEEEIFADLKTGGGEFWEDKFVCGARIGSGFKHDEQTGMEVTGNGFGSGDDEAHVWILGFAKRRRDTDVDGIERANDGKICGGAELAAFDERRKSFVWDVFDVGMASVELIDLGLLDVDADDFEAGFGEFDGERKTDVTEAEDAYFGGFVADFILQLSGYR